MFNKDLQYYKFCAYGFLKNLKFFEPFFILYLHESKVDYFHIGILFTIRAIVTNIIEIPSGVVADSIGRRKAMILGFLSYIISFVIFFLFHSFSMLCLAMIFFAFGDAFRTGTHKAIILHYLKEKNWLNYRSIYYGNTRSWSQRGSALSSLIAAFLVFYTGSYKSAFAFSIVPYFLGFILLLSYPTWLDLKEENNKKESKKNIMLNTIKDLITNLKIRETRSRLFSTSIPKGFFESVKDYIQPIIVAFSLSLPFFNQLGLEKRNAAVTGIIYFLIFVFTSFASSMASSTSARFKNTESFLSSVLFAGILALFASGLAILLKSTLVPVILFMMFYFLHNLRVPVAISYFSEKTKHNVMATALSIEAQLKTIVVAILSPIIGLLIDSFGLGIAIISVSCLGLTVFIARVIVKKFKNPCSYSL